MEKIFLSIFLLLLIYEILEKFNFEKYYNELKYNKLNNELINWEKKGKYYNINNKQIFGINNLNLFNENNKNECNDGDDNNNENHYNENNNNQKKNNNNRKLTYIIIHGYPSSSFEYSYNNLNIFEKYNYNYVLHDHIGFGFSEKLNNNFGYSIQDHADITLEYWKTIGVTGDCIIIAHDMGTSILTEILTRLSFQNNNHILPNNMRIKHVVFTNGGMLLEEYSPKFTQLLLLSSYGKKFAEIVSVIDSNGYFFKQQLSSVFSKYSNKSKSKKQIDLMMELVKYQKGDLLLSKTIRYIQDRYACEDRWMIGLKNTNLMNINISFVWGEDDPISPPTIPKKIIEKLNLTNSNLIIMKKKGHFLMMEDEEGDVWAETIINATKN